MNTSMTINQPQINDAYLQIQSLFTQIHYSQQMSQPHIIHNLLKSLNRCVEDLHDIKKQCDHQQELMNTTRKGINQDNGNSVILPSIMSQNRQHHLSVQDPNQSVNNLQQIQKSYPPFLNQLYEQDQQGFSKVNQSLSLEKSAQQNPQQAVAKIKVVNQGLHQHNNQASKNQTLNESYVKLENTKKSAGLINGQTTLNFASLQKARDEQNKKKQLQENIQEGFSTLVNTQNTLIKEIKKKIQKKQNKQKEQKDQVESQDQVDQKVENKQKPKKQANAPKQKANKQKDRQDDQISTNEVGDLIEWRKKLIDDNHNFSFSKKYLQEQTQKNTQDMVTKFNGIKLEENENQECLLCVNSAIKINQQTIKQYDGDKEIWVHPDCIKNATKTSSNQIDFIRSGSTLCGVCNQIGAFHKCQYCNQNYHWPCIQNDKGGMGCQCPMNIFS